MKSLGMCLLVVLKSNPMDIEVDGCPNTFSCIGHFFVDFCIHSMLFLERYLSKSGMNEGGCYRY